MPTANHSELVESASEGSRVQRVLLPSVTVSSPLWIINNQIQLAPCSNLESVNCPWQSKASRWTRWGSPGTPPRTFPKSITSAPIPQRIYCIYSVLSPFFSSLARQGQGAEMGRCRWVRLWMLEWHKNTDLNFRPLWNPEIFWRWMRCLRAVGGFEKLRCFRDLLAPLNSCAARTKCRNGFCFAPELTISLAGKKLQGFPPPTSSWECSLCLLMSGTHFNDLPKCWE